MLEREGRREARLRNVGVTSRLMPNPVLQTTHDCSMNTYVRPLNMAAIVSEGGSSAQNGALAPSGSSSGGACRTRLSALWRSFP